MTDDLMLLDGLDQSLPVSDDWILNRVQEIIDESIARRDVYYALNSCKTLLQVSQLSGVALAKFFYLIRSNWEIYGIEEDFEDIAYSYVGVHKATIDRYVTVWEMHDLQLIPKSVADEIRQTNIKTQIPIALTLAQGYEISDEDWQDLADAPDFTSVAAKIRDIKGKEPRKSALLIFIDSDGTLSAIQEGVTEFVGYLNEEPGNIAKKAIERIKRTAGVLSK